MSDRVFDSCERTFGYDASWTPTDGGATQNARVLFGEPTQDDLLGEFADSFTLRTFFMEWWADDFDGLFDSVESGTAEDVTISFDAGDRSFYVRHVVKKYDGRNYRAMLEENV